MFKFPNNKVYIGQSVDIYNRLNSHKWIFTSNNYKSQQKLYRAINKYGIENVEIVILWSTPRKVKEENITKLTLDKLEIKYINEYRAITDGYNISSGGQNNSRYMKLDEEQLKASREKLRNTLWGGISVQERFNYIYEYGLEKAAELLNVDSETLEKSIVEINWNKSATSFNRTTTNNANKAIENPEAMKLLEENYEYLRKLLVKDWDEDSEDLFHETVLYISYKFNPKLDFCTQFVKLFRSRRKLFMSDKKFVDINIEQIDDWEPLHHSLRNDDNEPIIY